MNNDRLPDYYEDLQISANADSETIERVFRLLAKRYHPDNNVTGNADAFTRISSAYKVLADVEKRASYDACHVALKAEKWKASETSSSRSLKTMNSFEREFCPFCMSSVETMLPAQELAFGESSS